MFTFTGPADDIARVTRDALRLVSRQRGYRHKQPRISITVDGVHYSDVLLIDLGRNEFGLFDEQPYVAGDLDKALLRFTADETTVRSITVKEA